MGKKFKHKKRDSRLPAFEVHSGKMPFIEMTDWSNFDIMDIRGDVVLARRKSTGAMEFIWPVADWEIESLKIGA